jgi:hypothetical protein
LASFQRIRYGRCGGLRVDVRSNWKEQPGMPDNWQARPAWERNASLLSASVRVLLDLDIQTVFFEQSPCVSHEKRGERRVYSNGNGYGRIVGGFRSCRKEQT